MPLSWGSSQSRDQTQVSYVSCIWRWVLYHQRHLGSPLLGIANLNSLVHSFNQYVFTKHLLNRLSKYMFIVGGGNGNPLQYSCLENPMDRRAWWAAVHRVAKSQTWLSDLTFTFHFHALEKKMAAHSSVLAWRIPGQGSLWAAVYGVTQSRTWLKWLSSSSSSNPIHYSYLENPMNRGSWTPQSHRVTKSQTWLKRLSTHTHMST